MFTSGVWFPGGQIVWGARSHAEEGEGNSLSQSCIVCVTCTAGEE